MIRRCAILGIVLAPAIAFAQAAAPSATQPRTPAPTAKVAASGVIGRKVLGPDGTEIGRVVDVLVDAGSNPRAAVIDFGGFLGVGARRIAVNWSDLTFPPTGGDADIKLDLNADQIREAPAYEDQTKPAAVVQPPPMKLPPMKDGPPGASAPAEAPAPQPSVPAPAPLAKTPSAIPAPASPPSAPPGSH